MTTQLSLLTRMTNLIKVAYELRKEMELNVVAQALDVSINDLLELESFGYIEVKVGFNKPTTFRATSLGYKEVLA